MTFYQKVILLLLINMLLQALLARSLFPNKEIIPAARDAAHDVLQK